MAWARLGRGSLRTTDTGVGARASAVAGMGDSAGICAPASTHKSTTYTLRNNACVLFRGALLIGGGTTWDKQAVHPRDWAGVSHRLSSGQAGRCQGRTQGARGRGTDTTRQRQRWDDQGVCPPPHHYHRWPRQQQRGRQRPARQHMVQHTTRCSQHTQAGDVNKRDRAPHHTHVKRR